MNCIYNIINVRARMVAMACLAATGALVACSDSQAPLDPEWSREPVAFAASVVGSRSATRSDGSIIVKNQTYLLPTMERTFKVWDDLAGDVVDKTESFSVGIFGAYTQMYDWDDTQEANLFFNQKADIGALQAGVNPLTYAPERFWPNQHDGADYEKCSFWAYYPWNETDASGDLGIGIVASDFKDKGMGTFTYTMHPDASQQSDFMLSELVTNRTKATNPLVSAGNPTPVQFKFHHMLAQVRIYAFIRATDKIVYDETVRPSGATAADVTAEREVVDAWGVPHKVSLDEPIPDDTDWLGVTNPQTVRWQRVKKVDADFNDTSEDLYDRGGKKKRANLHLAMQFNNIYTRCTYTPAFAAGKTSFGIGKATDLGSAMVNHYIQNPYWFVFSDKTGEEDRRVMLNDDFMYDFFEDAPSNSGGDNNALGYLRTAEAAAETKNFDDDRHFNYAPGNVLLVVPQTLKDDDVPNIVITAKGKSTSGSDLTAKVTVNMLNMDIKWEAGFIYCYAFVDDLKPGDDIVRGPESITVAFDPSKHTDQW